MLAPPAQVHMTAAAPIDFTDRKFMRVLSRSLRSTPEPFATDCGGSIEGYDLGLAVTAVFVIFVASLLGALGPAAIRFYNHPTIAFLTILLAFAGSGVIISTALVHLLAPAQEALGSPCLSAGWLDAYPVWAFLFATAAIVFMTIADYLVQRNLNRKKRHNVACRANSPLGEAWKGTLTIHSTSGIEAAEDEGTSEAEQGEAGLAAPALTSQVPISALVLSEVSIALHSVIIGLALGVTSASEFVPLFIAIVFHQLLEGLALGAIAVATRLNLRGIVALALLYSLSTPMGIAVGIAVRSSMNPDGQAALLTQGILDALSAGLLIYVALGDHINAVKFHGPWLEEQGALVVAACLISFAAGAATMTVLGIWA